MLQLRHSHNHNNILKHTLTLPLMLHHCCQVLEHLLKYVHTDGALIRYEPGTLERRQAAIFDPLLLWARQQLGWSLATSHSIFGTQQDEATVAAVEAWLQGTDTEGQLHHVVSYLGTQLGARQRLVCYLVMCTGLW
jgi:chaperone required for assembly of F1-ATPase